MYSLGFDVREWGIGTGDLLMLTAVIYLVNYLRFKEPFGFFKDGESTAPHPNY